MNIYIDEAGPFIPPRTSQPSFSLVLALIIPSAIEAELFYEFLRLRGTWPNQSVEIKGSSLNESQAAQVISLLLKFDVLVEFMALDMNTHPAHVVRAFKNGQADAVTANITRAHHPAPIPHLHQLGESVRAMPNQLFLQAFMTWELIIKTLREATLYFVQRQPQELGSIAWAIDRKDRVLTEMEETWQTLILPVGEHIFGTEPLACLDGADYSFFDARYGLSEATADPGTAQHLEWMNTVYNKSPGAATVNAKLLLSEQQSFKDSRDSLGLQLADMLASILRRAVNDRLHISGWRDFGGLLVRDKNPGHGFIQLGGLAGDPAPCLTGHPKLVCRVLDARAKAMLTK